MRNFVLVVFVLSCAIQPGWTSPIINEVFYDADGSDAPGVFTELIGAPGGALEGWSLVGINGANAAPYRTIDLTGAVFPDDGVFVVATSRADAALASVRDWIANVDWQNGPDAVQLIDPTGHIIDALQYGVGPTSSGEGEPAADAPSGLSLSRDPFALDTDDNRLDFTAVAPTPGRGGRVAQVPAPPTFVLLAAGWLWCARASRRRAARAMGCASVALFRRRTGPGSHRCE